MLFISYDGLTDPLGQSQILPYLIGLSKKGYDITILSCEKKHAFLNYESLIKQQTEVAGIEWMPLQYKSSIPIWSPYLNYKSILKTAKQICKNNDFNLVHCRSILPAMVGNQLKKQFKLKFLFDIRGFWADERVEGGIWNLRNPIFKVVYKFFKAQEKLLFRSADGIITLTQNAKDHILAHFETKRQIDVIPCSVDVDHFSVRNSSKEKHDELKNSLNITGNHYVLGYIGSLGTRYLLKDMLRFFSELKKKESKAIFLFVTKTPKDFIINHLNELGIKTEYVRITSTDYSKMPSYIHLMHASIFFVSAGFSGKAVSPTKQSEVLSMGKPIIANAGLGDTNILLKENNLGVLVPSFTPEKLNSAVKELLNHNYKPEEIRNAAIRLFSLDEAINNYQRMYQKLLGE